MNRPMLFIVVAALAAMFSTCPCPAVETPPPGEGWVSLFNGQDLTGWIIPTCPDSEPAYARPQWKVADGTIDCSGGARTLITDGEFGDYVLRFEWRWKFDPAKPPSMWEVPLTNPDGTAKLDESGQPVKEKVYHLDSGIYVRGEPATVYINKKTGHLVSGPCQVNLWARASGSGGVFGAQPGASGQPRQKADRPLGEWNTMEITVIGKETSVLLNGIEVAKDAEVPGMALRGPIHLQAHGGESLVQFRNLWIKELTP